MDRDGFVVETVGLTKVFSDFWGRPKVKAVDGLDLSLRRGEVFGLLGPNGSGKSTTVKLILGLLFPTKGVVRVFGRPPRDVRIKARIGFLPEESYLYPYLTAEEALDFYGRLFDIPAAERRRRVEALLAMVGLSGARRRPLGEFSKGMARRIGLAQALIGDPDLVVLDEPTSGMDPLGTRDVKDLILDLRSRGKTVLLCSHLLANVEDVCDRVAILFAGRIYAQGTLEELLTEKRLTQITAPELDEATREELLELIRRKAPGAQVRVGHPVQRLEDFFLRTVEEAYGKEPATSGAEAGAGKADFLAAAAVQAEDRHRGPERPSRPDPDDVIRRLTGGDRDEGRHGGRREGEDSQP